MPKLLLPQATRGMATFATAGARCLQSGRMRSHQRLRWVSEALRSADDGRAVSDSVCVLQQERFMEANPYV